MDAHLLSRGLRQEEVRGNCITVVLFHYCLSEVLDGTSTTDPRETGKKQDRVLRHVLECDKFVT